MIDLGDNLALYLARDGQEQPFTIEEYPDRFAIEWNAQYRIDGNTFKVIERSGQMRAVLGYPTAYITNAARQLT